jgi:hypothetical protein
MGLNILNHCWNCLNIIRSLQTFFFGFSFQTNAKVRSKSTTLSSKWKEYSKCSKQKYSALRTRLVVCRIFLGPNKGATDNPSDPLTKPINNRIRSPRQTHQIHQRGPLIAEYGPRTSNTLFLYRYNIFLIYIINVSLFNYVRLHALYTFSTMEKLGSTFLKASSTIWTNQFTILCKCWNSIVLYVEIVYLKSWIF